jgi:hypothetical protein
MKNSTRNVLLVLGGLIVGCGAATVAPIRIGSAAPTAGWRCYVIDRFPDVQDAADWSGAAKVTQGMNQVAPATPAGTVITAYWSSGTSSVVCVKN